MVNILGARDVKYLDHTDTLQTRRAIEKDITSQVIDEYRYLLSKLKGVRLEACYISVRSEADRLDISLPIVNATFGSIFTCLIAVIIALFTPTFWLSLLLIMAYLAFFSLPLLIWANTMDSRKRQHYSVILSILQTMLEHEQKSNTLSRNRNTRSIRDRR